MGVLRKFKPKMITTIIGGKRVRMSERMYRNAMQAEIVQAQQLTTAQAFHGRLLETAMGVGERNEAALQHSKWKFSRAP